ncbi:N-acetyltransferase [Kribbella sp. NPDC051770]|uniref:GNAT family N-acetyltransferase n=1 Tax=Kribbella sp. NPDC051770 TaxID=3155413 RepID=UPI0034407BBF
MSTTWITRAESGADSTAVDAVNFHAFGRRLEPDIVLRLRTSNAWIPTLSYVATRAGEIVAHALLSRCHIDESPALVLGPVAVLPQYQGAGAGSATIRAALAAARAEGEHAVVVLGHHEYYPRFGFRQATDSGIHSPYDGPNQMALGLVAERILPRGTIRYPTAWEA